MNVSSGCIRPTLRGKVRLPSTQYPSRIQDLSTYFKVIFEVALPPGRRSAGVDVGGGRVYSGYISNLLSNYTSRELAVNSRIPASYRTFFHATVLLDRIWLLFAACLLAHRNPKSPHHKHNRVILYRAAYSTACLHEPFVSSYSTLTKPHERKCASE